MSDLVHQGEPEVVEPIVSESQTDNWSAIGVLQCRPVKLRALEVRLDDDSDAMLLKEFHGQKWASLRPTQLGKFSQKARGQLLRFEWPSPLLRRSGPLNSASEPSIEGIPGSR